MNASEFYQSNNLVKYPNDGKMNQCKKCLTMHVDNWNPDTYLWILQEIDVPYVPDEWNKILAKYAQNKKSMTGMSVLGRYLSKMKLKQFKDYRWADTEFLQEVANNKTEQAMKRSGYSAAQIEQVIQEGRFEIPKEPLPQPEYADDPPQSFSEIQQEDYFEKQSEDNAFNDDLTEEDRIYLRLKWGRAYKPEEWIRLEQLYEEMMGSYDIHSAGHIDTLKLICKTSLKANQLIDIGDIDGFQKMSKVYDSLMKSGNFTAAQNKAKQGEFVDSIGELIDICEKQGYIERFYSDTPNDKVDLTIQDMQRYTRTLIEEETNLTLMVEKAIRDNEKEDQKNAENTEDEIVDDIDLSLEDLERTIKDKDFEEFEDFVDNQASEDEIYLTKEAES